MTSPSLLARESITLSSMLPQNGHFMMSVYREPFAEHLYPCTLLLKKFWIVDIFYNRRDDVCDLLHLCGAHASRCDTWGTDANAAGYHGRELVERNGILVEGHAVRSSASSASLPVTPRFVRSTSMR